MYLPIPILKFLKMNEVKQIVLWKMSYAIKMFLSSLSITSTASTSKTSNMKLDLFIVRTTKIENDNNDLQIAKFIYTNSLFRVVEHKEFKKMISLLRPG